MNAFRTKNAALLILFAIFITFRIWLIAGIPKLLIYGLHDDYYFAKMAHHLVRGEWMGPYSQMTLIKSPFYGFFLVFSSLTGLPLLVTETLFYIVGCLVLYFAISPLVKNHWWRFLLFLLLLYCPASLVTIWTLRVYREFVYFSLSLYVVATFIGLFLRIEENKKLLAGWAVGAGISLGAFLITREEGVWILPAILLMVSVSILLLIIKRNEQKWIRALILTTPIILGFLPQLVISGFNYSHYGFWGTSENLDQSFNRVLIALGRIKTAEWCPYSQITKAGLEKGFQVSPTLAEFKTLLDQQWENWVPISTVDLESRPAWFFEKYHVQEGELGMYFNWMFRDVLAHQGEFDKGYPAVKLATIADELEEACSLGTLECYPRISLPLVSSLSWDHLPIVKDFISEEIRLLINFEQVGTRPYPLDFYYWVPYPEETNYFDEFVYNPFNYRSLAGYHNDEVKVDNNQRVKLNLLAKKGHLMEEINNGYWAVTRALMIILVLGGLLISIIQVRNKTYLLNLQPVVVFFFLLGLLLSRIVTLAVISATTNVPSNYGASNYIYLNVVIFLLFYYVIHNVEYVPKQPWELFANQVGKTLITKNYLYKIALIICSVVLPLVIINLITENLPAIPKRQKLELRNGNLYQFSLKNGKLTATGDDPNITFEPIIGPVESILINCSNAISNSESQVFYRDSSEQFSEVYSFQYQPKSYGMVFYFPKTSSVNSIRLDLTYIAGDVVSCRKIVVNPKSGFDRAVIWGLIYLFFLSVFILYRYKDNPRVKAIFNKIRHLFVYPGSFRNFDQSSRKDDSDESA